MKWPRARMICTLVLGTLLALSSQLGLSEYINYKMIRPLEFKLRIAWGQDPKLDPRLKIYSYDDSTLRAVKDNDLPINTWLEIFDGLLSSNPKLVMIDKIFGIAKGDYHREEVMEKLQAYAPKLVTGVFLTPQLIRTQAPFPIHDDRFTIHRWLGEGSSALNLNWLTIDSGYVYGPDEDIVDGLINFGHLNYEGHGRVKLFQRYQQSFAVPHWSLHAADELVITEQAIKVNGTRLNHQQNLMSINMIDPEKLRQNVFSLQPIISRVQAGRSFSSSINEDQIVIILPAMYTGNADMMDSPFGMIPGGYFMVAMVNSVLTGKWIRTVPESLWSIALLTVLGFLLSHWLGQLWSSLVASLGAILIAGAGIAGFIYFAVQTPWFLLSLTLLLVTFGNLTILAIEREIHSQRIEQALAGLIPADQVATLMKHPEAMNFKAVGQVVSIMFVDIVGFSLTSRRLAPADAFKELKQILGEITSIVHRYQGTIDKTLGDGLLCFFGYDVFGRKTDCHADLAVRCGIEIQRHCYNRSLAAAQNGAAIYPLRIGINSASVYIGNIGNEERFDFTLVGDGVIFASRLETACSPFKIMIGPSTKGLLMEFSPHQPGMVKRFLMVKHHSELIEAWEVDPFLEGEFDLAKLERLYWNYAEIEMREERFYVPPKADVVIQSPICRMNLMNYSMSGLGVNCDKYLATGVVFSLALDSADGSLATELAAWGLAWITVEICWGRSGDKRFQHGVRYIGLNDLQKNRIFSLLEKRFSQSPVLVRSS